MSDGLSERLQDRVWRVQGGRDQRLDVMVCLEFQSTVDRTMALRILDHTVLLYQEALRNAPSKPLPPVLFIVLYHGHRQWTARTDIAPLLAPHGALLAPYQPSQRHFVLDVGGQTGALPGNATEWRSSFGWQAAATPRRWCRSSGAWPHDCGSLSTTG